MEIEQLDAPLVLAFPEAHRKRSRQLGPTRNARLAAVNSFFRFLEYRLPSCLDQSRRIHAIPMKKTDEALIGYLTVRRCGRCSMRQTRTQVRHSRSGDVAFGLCGGLRVSELISLRLDHLDGQACSSIHVMGKGRRERVLPWGR